MLEYALSFVTEEYERVSMDYGEQGSAMSEGALDAGAGTFINGSVEPGWLQQMKGRSTCDCFSGPTTSSRSSRKIPPSS